MKDMSHLLLWGNTKERESAADRPAKAAYVDGRVMLISAGAIDRNDMPPGFQGFVSDAEYQSMAVTDAEYRSVARGRRDEQ